ncbi:MAG: GIY-YIG nuclease family protein [Sphingomonadaceae bacterium]
MNVESLTPRPDQREAFRRAQTRFIPTESGCYVLATFAGEIIYIGLAKSLRRRFEQHLDTPEKTSPTKLGKAAFFYWLEYSNLKKLERSWMNAFISDEGALPVLNKLYSPVSV